MSVQRLISVVRHSQQASRVNAAMRGPSKEKEFRNRQTKANGKTDGAALRSESDQSASHSSDMQLNVNNLVGGLTGNRLSGEGTHEVPA